MVLTKDKCMVNLDKAGIIVPECCAVLKKTGTTTQTIFKSSYNANRCAQDFANLNPPVYFMPIILHKKDWEKKTEQGWAQLEPYTRQTHPSASWSISALASSIGEPGTCLDIPPGVLHAAAVSLPYCVSAFFEQT
jgi:hypothetical protein